MRPLPKEREGAATTPRQLSLKAPASTSEADADWRSIWWWVGGGGGGAWAKPFGELLKIYRFYLDLIFSALGQKGLEPDP